MLIQINEQIFLIFQHYDEFVPQHQLLLLILFKSIIYSSISIFFISLNIIVIIQLFYKINLFISYSITLIYLISYITSIIFVSIFIISILIYLIYYFRLDCDISIQAQIVLFFYLNQMLIQDSYSPAIYYQVEIFIQVIHTFDLNLKITFFSGLKLLRSLYYQKFIIYF